jgi:hypothetical protein
MAAGRALQLALAAEHAQWLLGHGDRSGRGRRRQLVALSPVPDLVGSWTPTRLVSRRELEK